MFNKKSVVNTLKENNNKDKLIIMELSNEDRKITDQLVYNSKNQLIAYTVGQLTQEDKKKL
jgi:hypothetical protein